MGQKSQSVLTNAHHCTASLVEPQASEMGGRGKPLLCRGKLEQTVSYTLKLSLRRNMKRWPPCMCSVGILSWHLPPFFCLPWNADQGNLNPQACSLGCTMPFRTFIKLWITGTLKYTSQEVQVCPRVSCRNICLRSFSSFYTWAAAHPQRAPSGSVLPFGSWVQGCSVVRKQPTGGSVVAYGRSEKSASSVISFASSFNQQ